MKIVTNENIRPFDVDNCIIMHEALKDIKPKDRVKITDPLTGGKLVCRINRAMVRLLKEEYQRGGYVIVWSRGGWEWAENVVKALGIDIYVDQVMSKPIVYFDDTPVKDWMTDRVFINADTKYKE